MTTKTFRDRSKHYEIQWLVPTENAIGGTSYWTPLELENGKTKSDSFTYILENYKKAEKNYPPNTIRLVRVTQEVIPISSEGTIDE